MNKRERVIAAIEGREPDRVPSCFSLHFPKDAALGAAGAESHLDFFRQTDTDVLKIMNEYLVPDVGDIRRCDDWNKIPSYSMNDSFLKNQVDMVKRILDGNKETAFTAGTIHGICASAIHPIEARYGYVPVRELMCTHIRENKKTVLEAFKRITEAMCLLARAYREAGLDAVYYAGLGGETRFFTDDEFAECIAPFDLEILGTFKQAGGYNIVHICKDGLNMKRYTEYASVADVLNWGVYETHFSIEQGRELFPGKTIMGGLANRSGVLVDGTIEELTSEVRKVRDQYGKTGFILGADCTLPTEIPYERIRAAVHAVR